MSDLEVRIRVEAKRGDEVHMAEYVGTDAEWDAAAFLARLRGTKINELLAPAPGRLVNECAT